MAKRKLENPKASLYPVPVALITCYDVERCNIITISWTGIMCSNPPIIYISVRPERYSHQLLAVNGRFCLDIPSVEMLSAVDYCGNISGEIIDKSEMCGFELLDLVEGYPKAIKQCKHHLFCDVIDQMQLGSHDVFIAEVKFEFVNDDCCTENHAFDYDKILPIAYCRKDYYSLDKKIGRYGKEKGGISNE